DLQLGVPAGDFKYLVGGPLDDAGAGVVILVDAVPEAHQLELAGLHLGDIGRHLVLGADDVQHFEDFFVGAPVERAGERGAGGGGGEERIGLGTSRGAHGV